MTLARFAASNSLRPAAAGGSGGVLRAAGGLMLPRSAAAPPSVELARDARRVRKGRDRSRALCPPLARQSLRRVATPVPRDELSCFDALDSLGFEPCLCCSAPRPGATLIHSHFGRVRAEVCSAIPPGTRNALAVGQQRFEKSKEVPKQSKVEVHSERVTCVLGMNPNHYTLNGTNCWLVGTGKQRLLIDTGEKQQRVEFLANLKDAMARVGCEGLCAIAITHMHGDHTGGIDTLQQVCLPVCLPVCLSVCRSVCRSVGLSVGLSLFIRLSLAGVWPSDPCVQGRRAQTPRASDAADH